MKPRRRPEHAAFGPTVRVAAFRCTMGERVSAIGYRGQPPPVHCSHARSGEPDCRFVRTRPHALVAIAQLEARSDDEPAPDGPPLPAARCTTRGVGSDMPVRQRRQGFVSRRDRDSSVTPPRLKRSRPRCRRWPPDRGPDRSHLVAALRRLQKSQAVVPDGRISGKAATCERRGQLLVPSSASASSRSPPAPASTRVLARRLQALGARFWRFARLLPCGGRDLRSRQRGYARAAQPHLGVRGKHQDEAPAPSGAGGRLQPIAATSCGVAEGHESAGCS